MINFIIGLLTGAISVILFESTKHFWKEYILNAPERKRELLYELGRSHQHLMKNEIEGWVRELPGIIIIGINPNIKNEFVTAYICKAKNIKARIFEISKGENINRCLQGALHIDPRYKAYEIDSTLVRFIKYWYYRLLLKPVCIRHPNNDKDAFVLYFR